MADAGQVETFTGSDGFGGASTAASTTSTPSGTTDAIGASLGKIFSDPTVQKNIAAGVSGAVGAVENLFGIQTPQQQQAAAAAAAAQQAQQQQTMLLVGGAIAGVVLLVVVIAVVRGKG